MLMMAYTPIFLCSVQVTKETIDKTIPNPFWSEDDKKRLDALSLKDVHH